jgi:isoquinoline 1-oxidoreductase beta subunit
MGGIMMGLSAALKEKVEVTDGGIRSANFDDYELLRMSEAPEVEVHIVKSGATLGGIGEPGVPPVIPAVGNAVFAATGVRVRMLPMKPETVVAAIKRG